MSGLSKLKWQCRRGTLELDILLQNYLSQRYKSAPSAEQQAFVELLALEDTELLPYLMGDRLPQAENLSVLVKKIRVLTPIYHQQ